MAYYQNQSNQQTGGYWGNDPAHPGQKKWYGSGQPTMSPLGRPINQSTDPYQLQQQKPTISSQGPYQMPGGLGVDPTYQNPGASMGMNPAGPRPQQPPMAGPGQSADIWNKPYTGPQFAPVQRPPQSAFGQQNQTVFNPHFANTPAGRAQMQPYQSRPPRQPGQNQFLNTAW